MWPLDRRDGWIWCDTTRADSKAGRSKGTPEGQQFRPEKRNASGVQPRGDPNEEVRPMRPVRVKWGVLVIEVPGELFLALMIKAFLMLHKLNV